jgi:23S rRNA pseudouridine2604 synthase
LSKYMFKIVLIEGLYRQIRRMCEYFNYEVISLKRVRIMHIRLDLPVGKYRMLTLKEQSTLFETLGHQK